jgi:hypothetical protein
MGAKLKHILKIAFSKDYILVTKKGNYTQTELSNEKAKKDRLRILQQASQNIQLAIRRIETTRTKSINFIETEHRRVTNT